MPAGDITPNSQLAIVAAAEAAMAAIHIHQSLIPAERKIVIEDFYPWEALKK